jgi:hypothetical protein
MKIAALMKTEVTHSITYYHMRDDEKKVNDQMMMMMICNVREPDKIFMIIAYLKHHISRTVNDVD